MTEEITENFLDIMETLEEITELSKDNDGFWNKVEDYYANETPKKIKEINAALEEWGWGIEIDKKSGTVNAFKKTPSMYPIEKRIEGKVPMGGALED